MSDLISPGHFSGWQEPPFSSSKESIPNQQQLMIAKKIINDLGDNLNQIVAKILSADQVLHPDDAEKRVMKAAKLIHSTTGATFESRMQAKDLIYTYANQIPNKSDPVKEIIHDLSEQLVFDQAADELVEQAASALENLSDQTVGLLAGSGDIYLGHLISLQTHLRSLEALLETPAKDTIDRQNIEKLTKYLKGELEDELHDIAKAIKPECKRATTEYDTAFKEWHKAMKSKDPAVIFPAFLRLDEAGRHLENIGLMKDQVAKFGFQEIASKLTEVKDVKEQRKLFMPEFTELMDQIEPSQIRNYVTERLAKYDSSNLLALKREMWPFFSGCMPLLPAQKADFKAAQKDIKAIFKEPIIYDSKMQSHYLNQFADLKKLHERTSIETESKLSKIGIFFLAMQAMMMLRGAGSLLSGRDFKELKSRAEIMHNQAIQSIDPEIREKIERDGSRMGAFLHDKWDAMRNMDAKTLNNFIKKLSPSAQEAIKILIQDASHPTSEKIQAACDAVIAKELSQEIPSPYSHMSIREWFKVFMKQQPEKATSDTKNQPMPSLSSKKETTLSDSAIAQIREAQNTATEALFNLQHFDLTNFNVNADKLKEHPNWKEVLKARVKRFNDRIPFDTLTAYQLRGFDLEVLRPILETIPQASHLLTELPTSIIRQAKMKALGSGAVNTVYKMNDNGIDKIFKPDPSLGVDFTTSLKESYFGTAQAAGIPVGTEAHFPSRAVAASLVDDLLYKKGRISVETNFAHVNGQRGIMMSMAKGRSPQMTGTKEERISLKNFPHIRKWIEKKIEKQKTLTSQDLNILAANLKLRQVKIVGNPPGKWKLVGISAVFSNFKPDNPATCEGLLKLQVKDIITGEVDRHPGNYFIDPATGGITGVDEDCSFGVDAIPENVDVRKQETLFFIIPNKASLMLRMPPVVTKEIKSHIDDLYQNKAQLVETLTPLISQPEIDATLRRLDQLHAHVNDKEKCLVVDKKEDLISKKARERIDPNNSYWARELLVFDKDKKGWNHLRAGIPSREIIPVTTEGK